MYSEDSVLGELADSKPRLRRSKQGARPQTSNKAKQQNRCKTKQRGQTREALSPGNFGMPVGVPYKAKGTLRSQRRPAS
eukprot:1143089-Pelagomonas_calceolata.AAC.18